jgi:hypothetical protein
MDYSGRHAREPQPHQETMLRREGKVGTICRKFGQDPSALPVSSSLNGS